MELRDNNMEAHPFLYVGLLLIALSVVVGLLADHPAASEKTALSLDLLSVVSVTCGLAALLLAPLFRAFRHKG